MLMTRTIVPTPPAPSIPAIRHADELLLLGSCFSDEVGTRLQNFGHCANVNPLGTIFNACSLRTSLELYSTEDASIDHEQIQYCERQKHYYSFDAGTVHTHSDRDACIASLDAAVAAGRQSLLQSRCLFLTLGSAWAYVLRSNGRIVANCHKQPQDAFDRILMSPSAIEDDVRGAIAAARSANPDLSIVLTVSPVRHLREGAVASSRSKAHLLSAVHAVCDDADNDGIAYYPSFELINDELRDYRWYAEDMIHPSSAAADYVTERLLEAHFDRADDSIRAEVLALRTAARHRHAHPASANAKAFARAQRDKALRLLEQHSHLDLHEDLAKFEAMADGV